MTCQSLWTRKCQSLGNSTRAFTRGIGSAGSSQFQNIMYEAINEASHKAIKQQLLAPGIGRCSVAKKSMRSSWRSTPLSPESFFGFQNNISRSVLLRPFALREVKVSFKFSKHAKISERSCGSGHCRDHKTHG